MIMISERKDTVPRGECARSANDAKEWKQKQQWPNHVQFEDAPTVEQPQYPKILRPESNRRSLVGNASQICHEARRAWGL